MKSKILKQRIWILVLVISIIILIFSGLKLFLWDKDNKDTDKQIKNISNDVKVEEVKKNDKEELVNKPKEDKNNDYWNYIKLPLINVDFNNLLKKNSDTVAFIKVNGTNINYPVVQTNDNKYYLNHSFDKSYNEAGWIFMDYRNNLDNLSANTIIYGHGRWDTTMFGTLKNVFKNNWYNNTDNYILNLSTNNYNSMWQIFSVYKIKTENYYLTSDFGTTESHQKFINTIISRSAFKFNASVNTDDKIITLSTCLNDSEKVVMHAKLIKKQPK